MTAPITNNNTTTNNTDHHRQKQQQQQLPVVIAGAGPCGLVAAYCLQQYGVPFVIIEKASRSKICSNAGSGFELAPTSVEILQNRLGLDVSSFMSKYEQLNIMTMDGKHIRDAKLPEDYAGGSVNRAELQNHFLELLFPSPKDEEGILLCGSGVDSYREEDLANNGGVVVVTLASGREVTGCVLLACDGIHSRCRAVLHGGYDHRHSWETNTKTMAKKDPLHFCKAVSYWGKTRAPEGSNLRNEFHTMVGRSPTTATESSSDDGKNNRAVAVIGLSTRKSPASFFVIPTQNFTMLNWAITVRNDESGGGGGSSEAHNGGGGDLTRRGGGPLTPSEKKRLFDFGSNDDNDASLVKGVEGFSFLEALLEATPAEDITEAGLFDRKNLNLPYTSDSKLVALLGDSAHPQTPFMGQGVNMAIADAYMYATNIAMALRTNNKKKSLREAVRDSDPAFRRKEGKKVVEGARQFCDFSVTQNPMATTLLRLYSKYASSRELVSQVVKTDKSNRHYLKHLDGKLCSPKQQEALRQKQPPQQAEA